MGRRLRKSTLANVLSDEGYQATSAVIRLRGQTSRFAADSVR